MVIFLVALAATYKASEVGRADQLDAWWLQARFSLRERLSQPHPDPRIVLVELDDRSAVQWPEPAIAWGAHFAAAIDRIRKGGARLVAMDWVQPEPTGKWFNSGFSKNDTLLADALSKVPHAVMVKEVRLGGATGRNNWIRPINEILFSLPNAGADPDVNLGYAELSTKESVVAAVSPAQPADKGWDESFPARIAEQYLGGMGQPSAGAWTVPGKVTVPLREDGTFLINYANSIGYEGAFERYSLSDVAQPSVSPDTRFRDKIVIIGVTFTGSNEQHYVPFLAGLTRARMVYGPEIQANVVRTLLDGRPIVEPGRTGIWLLSLLVALIGLVAFYFKPWAAAAGISVATAVGWVGLALALFMAAGYALPIGVPVLGLLLTSGLMGGYRALREERERAEVLSLWGRYQDPRLVQYLLQHRESRGGEGQEKIVTVLFADLKNFTKTVEALPPNEALQVLNRYLALLNDVIMEYAGVVDKYLGDGLMAQWGAPEPWSQIQLEQDHATAAVRACIEIASRAEELTASIQGQHEVTFSLRLTLHTGPVVVGWVGADRLEYTIIGDTVNVTSRLQETAKQLGCDFLISENTYQAVGEWIITGQEAEVEIRGRQRPLRVYEVLGLRESASPPPAVEANGQGSRVKTAVAQDGAAAPARNEAPATRR